MPFLVETVIAQKFAVVTDKDDEGVIKLTDLFQRSKYPAYLLVNVADGGVINLTHAADVSRVGQVAERFAFFRERGQGRF